MISKAFLESLSPVELEYIHSIIYTLYRDNVTEETTNYDNLAAHMDQCPHCHSKRIVKNGFNPKGRQKYLCKDCHRVVLPTTGTMFSHSKIKYTEWVAFIGCELQGLSLEAEGVITGLHKTTCFNMRHRLYSAISSLQKDTVLSGNIEFDPTYTKINLKGTKPKNMPRISKPRGKHKTSVFGKDLTGTSHHKICIVTAVDENDNILLKIGGLGTESIEMFNKFSSHFTKKSLLISDGRDSIINFAKENKMKSDAISSTGGKVRYTTPLGNSLSSINEIHSEIKNMIREKHGVSTRHLQGYLDFLIFCKRLRYTARMKDWRDLAYMDVMFEKHSFRYCDTCKLPFPVSLYDAYHEYNYGIFRLIN